MAVGTLSDLCELDRETVDAEAEGGNPLADGLLRHAGPTAVTWGAASQLTGEKATDGQIGAREN